MDYMILTTPLSGAVCYPWARTCYYQSDYKICSLSLPIQRTEMEWLRVVRVTQGH